MGSTHTDKKGYKRYGDSGLLEHRVIASKKIGGPIGRGRVVHHVNGDRSDNRGSNLRVMSGSNHSSLEAKKRRRY